MHTERLGSRYTLSDRIGSGAMGEVRLARTDEGGDKPVAVKLLRPELAGDIDLVARFLQEARLLRSVEHPHVVRVLDLVAEGNRLAIVMEYVSGGDLRRAVPRPSPEPVVRDIFLQIAEGLAAIHAAGIVHRDLKPENVLVEHDAEGSQRARVTDFGISHRTGAGASGAEDMVGTAAYLSPECVNGQTVGPKADIYALGVMAYELITGNQPFAADDDHTIIKAHLQEAVPRPPSMSDPWWDLVSRMVAKEPNQRPSASEVAGTLRGFPAPLRDSVPPTQREPEPDVEATTLLRAPDELASLRAERGCDTMLRAPETPAARPRRLPRRPVVAAIVAGVAVLAAAVGMRIAPAHTATATPGATPSGSRSAGALPAPTAPRSVPTTSAPTARPSAPTGSHQVIRAPQVPVLAADLPSDALASDSQAPLRIDGVAAGSGKVAEILVSYDDGSKQVHPSAKSTGPYRTTIRGLVNGRRYAFHVRVCNSFGKCSESKAVDFTPFGLPQLNAMSVEAAGLRRTLVIPPVDLDGNPRSWACSVTAEANLPDDQAPAGQTVSPDGDQIIWFAAPLHRYTARQSCTSGTATLTGPALSFQT